MINESYCSTHIYIHTCDLDQIYGPSLPFLVPAQSQSVRRSPQNPRNILPLESLQSVAGEGNVTGEAIEGDGRRLKMLSFGHVNPHSGAPGAVLDQ